MKKNKRIIKGIALGIVFLFVGMIVIQSMGSSDQKQSASMSIDLNDFLQSENGWTDNQNDSQQTTLDNNEIDSDFTDSTIIAFLDKITHKYPMLKQMGKNMGLTKQGVSDTIHSLGDENMIKTFISIFSRIVGI